MVFSSSYFLFLYLPITLISYFSCKIFFKNIKIQNILLLSLSLLFYILGGLSLSYVIFLSILINYIFGFLIDFSFKKFSQKISLFTLFMGIFSNLLLLFYFKYFNFSIDILNKIFKLSININEIILPIGISFFTFQGLSYIIDLYRKKAQLQKNIINFSLYISLFPQLIAGPIVRYVDINEQIKNRNTTLEYFYIGTKRFLIGLSKKVIIANELGYIADQIFNTTDIENYASLPVSLPVAWLGAICYMFQVYYDFSGYSDMAIGLGKIFGFDFLENFNYPYISKSIKEFWRRWHISLSSFFRDYIYIPLGGNRRGNVYFNLLVVFIITGLWHGAQFSFIFWGLWHGIFIIIEKIFENKNIKLKIPVFIKYIFTMLIVLIGWVFFRLESIKKGFEFIKIMFNIEKANEVYYTLSYFLDLKIIILIIIAFICSFPLVPYLKKKFKNNEFLIFLSDIFVFFIFIISVILIFSSSYNPFIYFRF